MERYDLVVVGSGAGLMVLEEALKHGLRCAVIEKSKFGGTCLTKGCIPSKMLVYPADFIRETERADRIGLQVPPAQWDWDVISRRMWQQIDFHKQIRQNLEQTPNLSVYQGSGAFTGPNTMVIRYDDGRPEETICGSRYVIAAGARTLVPETKGLEEAGYLTSERFFGDKFPDKPWNSLVILGSGAISLEFAHIFSAFGTKVTIIARSGRIARKEDHEISAFLQKQLETIGVDIWTDSGVTEVTTENNQKRLTIENRLDHQRRIIICDEILVASGVQSNADTLAPEAAGIALDEHGWIVTNEYLETSQPHIWALGDINGKYQLRHKANHEALVVARNLFGGQGKTAADYRAVPRAIFTHPQVASIGLTEWQAKEKGIAYRCAKNHYSEVVAGIAMGYRSRDDDNGFVKLIVGEKDQILGVHIVGPQAAALMQPFVYLMQVDDPCRETLLFNSMVIHPSLSELTAWVFEKLD